MTPMARTWLAVAVLTMVSAVAGGVEPPRALTHRVWLLNEIPDEAALTTLRAAGIDGVVVPVGKVELNGGGSHFSLGTVPDLKSLAGWPVTALVWVGGSGRATGDPATFAAQLAPVQRSLPGAPGLLLAARQYSPGVVAFATGVAGRLHQRVELALPATALAQVLPSGGWDHLHPVAVAFGNPPALGFPPSTLQDDLSALDHLDALGVPYRVAVVVAPHADPAPGPAGASLAVIASGETASYHPGERGDAFQLRKEVNWGGTTVAAGRTITVEMVDTARYNRDLGLLLRPARPLLEGWDTVGLPASEPTLGMSRTAFLAFLEGGSTYPTPEVTVEWPGAATMRVALLNPTEQASAVATTGNWVELRFSGTDVRDVQLGDFSGMEYGRVDDGVWHRTVARDASAVRLYLTFLAPRARIGGCLVTFLSRPRGVSARWGLRLGDGSDVSGPLEPVPLTAR
jgi:hypothetical protein